MPDSAPATILWNFGRTAGREETTLTRDGLWELVTQGRRDDKGEVTTVILYAPTDRIAMVHIAVMCDRCGKMLYQHSQQGDQLVCP